MLKTEDAETELTESGTKQRYLALERK